MSRQFACTEQKALNDTSVSHEEIGEDATDSCVNTFDVTPMPDRQLTEYDAEVPSLESVLPAKLSETELYVDITSGAVHPAIRWFKPQYELWSDGENKNRWVYIPECERIDTSNINDWSFPVGTRFFKEFSVDGKRLRHGIFNVGLMGTSLHL